MGISADTISALDRQTDRQTDGRTDGIGVRMHSMLTRDKNERNTTAAINTTK